MKLLLHGLMMAGLLSVVGFSSAAKANDIAPGSIWTNQLNSVLAIKTVGSDGSVTGTFTTHDQDPNACGSGVPHPMTGWYNKGAFTFTVNFEKCASATAWAGQVDPKARNFVALWHLVLSGRPSFRGTWAGADTFTPRIP